MWFDELVITTLCLFDLFSKAQFSEKILCVDGDWVPVDTKVSLSSYTGDEILFFRYLTVVSSYYLLNQKNNPRLHKTLQI